MTELLLEDIESELFEVGLDFKRGYDASEEYEYINIISGLQHMYLWPLWSEPGIGDDDTYFFDNDDIHGTLFGYGEVDCEVDLFPETAEELVDLVTRIFGEGVDFLSEER